MSTISFPIFCIKSLLSIPENKEIQFQLDSTNPQSNDQVKQDSPRDKVKTVRPPTETLLSSIDTQIEEKPVVIPASHLTMQPPRSECNMRTRG